MSDTSRYNNMIYTNEQYEVEEITSHIERYVERGKVWFYTYIKGEGHGLSVNKEYVESIIEEVCEKLFTLEGEYNIVFYLKEQLEYELIKKEIKPKSKKRTRRRKK